MDSSIFTLGMFFNPIVPYLHCCSNYSDITTDMSLKLDPVLFIFREIPYVFILFFSWILLYFYFFWAFVLYCFVGR